MVVNGLMRVFIGPWPSFVNFSLGCWTHVKYILPCLSCFMILFGEVRISFYAGFSLISNS